MRTSIRLFLLTMVALLCTASTVAQEALWKELNSKFVKLYQQGRYSEAGKVAEESFKIAEKTFGSNHPYVASSLNDLANVYRAQSRYAEAEPLYKRSLRERELETTNDGS
jgi:tetratricopeptide (TPR) repeat protein